MKTYLRLFTLFMLLICWGASLQGQVYAESYLKTLEDKYHDIRLTATTGAGDGAVLVTGYIRKGESNRTRTPFIAKFNDNGGLDWFQEYLINGNETPAQSLKPVDIIVTYPDEKIIIAGNSFENEDEAFENPQRPFAIKVDHDGNLVYRRFYDCAQLSDVFETEEGMRFRLAYFCDVFVINDIESDWTNGATLAGYLQVNDTTKSGFILPINLQGRPQANGKNTFNHPAYQESEVVSVKRMNDGGHILLLRNETTKEASEYNQIMPSVIRLDQYYHTTWTKEIRDRNHWTYLPYGLTISQDFNAIYVLGHEQDNQLITKLGIDGSSQWTYKYSTPNYPDREWYRSRPYFARDYQDNLYISFDISNRENHVQNITFKTNSSGNLIWQRSFGNTDASRGITGMSIINNGPLQIPQQDLVLIGEHLLTEYSAWKVRVRTDNGSTDCTVNEREINPTLLAMDTYDYELTTRELYVEDYLYGFSQKEPQVVLDKCTGLRFRSQKQPIQLTPETIEQLNVFPNPNQGNFTLQIPYAETEAEVSIYDLSGKRIRFQKTAVGQQQIQLSNLPKGSYLVRCIQGQDTYKQKVIVQ